MFDPFGDFESAGYLRNTQGLKDSRIIKRIEHEVFRANLIDAVDFISNVENIEYGDFLKVHQILFFDFYPWAGKDRADIAPTIAVSKASVMFSHPRDAVLAVCQGLRIGQSGSMRQSLGEVMGLFAYGHPFLDGNGRTMLIVHSELCHRAGFSVDWSKTTKPDYLAALSHEIASPNDHVLDRYLSRFIAPEVPRARWFETITAIDGLDGNKGRVSDVVEGDFSDEDVAGRYRDYEARRGYGIAPSASPGDARPCDDCGQAPCICLPGARV
ncbi:Fic family protein [Azospirillum sp. TSH100]|uniref:Fic/DOC family protein n=1 Tax=Azospirillum sp. TSH100 TaxID=652764 RepID=UPI000D647342|nr:Fic family protein [Azospirillum sp. TSH100]QCG91003.1 cell filamentation protein Fic [Azospirillum sp. TSH100]